MKNISIKIITKYGNNECPRGHKVGDKIDLNDIKAPPICKPLLNALQSPAMALMFGAELPWLKDKDVTRIACPDPENPVVVEIRRTKVD